MDEDGCKIERRKYQIVNEFCAESGFAHRRIRQFIASEKRGCSRDLWTAPLFCDAYFNGLKYDIEQRQGISSCTCKGEEGGQPHFSDTHSGRIRSACGQTCEFRVYLYR